MRLPDIHQYDTYVPILARPGKTTYLGPGGELVVEVARAARRRILPRAPRGPDHPALVRPLPQPGKAERRILQRQLRRRPIHPDELPAATCSTTSSRSPTRPATPCTACYSARTSRYQYYNYTIFVAEVASTFNEQLLARHMMASAENRRKKRAYLINRSIDGIRGTIIRQTMFAEFEKIIHDLVEKRASP